ncbi:MFS transporter [Allonocardiopsis opalescens]|uniref:MFS transporter n=1 Tax=Allonocardiopsis opalescens TaxID=1144618 RepID=UPI001B809BA4|nr:MFS transporter [Allonocardiopsis opalescens]
MTTNPNEAVGDTSATVTPRQWMALFVIAGAFVLDVSGLAVLNAALPAIGTSFTIDDSTLQWAMTSYAVTFAGFLLLGGRLADVKGRRPVFIAGVALFCVAALVGAMAPNALVLILARAAQGLGAALSGPAALALLTEVFPEGPARNRAMGIYTAVAAASFSGGMILGGVLTQLLGWRSTFIFSVVLGVAVLALCKVALPPGVRNDRSLDVPGAVLVTLGLALIVFGLTRGAEVGWGDATTVVPLVVAVALLGAFVAWERRVAEPLVPFSIFGGAPVRAAALAAFTHFASVNSMLFFAPLYMQNVLGYSPLQSGLAIVPMGLSVVILSNVTGRLLHRVGQGPFMIYGMPLIGLGILTWMWTGDDTSYWLLLPGILIMTLGQATTFPALTAASLTGVPQPQHGIAGAVNVTAQQIGSSVGIAALVAVAAVGTVPGPSGEVAGYHLAYLTAAIGTVVGSVLMAIVLRGDGRARPHAAAVPAAPAEQPHARPVESGTTDR